MIFFGRKISLTRIPLVIYDFAIICYRIFIFKNPIKVLIYYLNRDSPKSAFLTLRSGLKLNLSSNKHDTLTAVVIFCRQEYGGIDKDWVIIDIGANIGLFTLYALNSEASKIFSYEPNPESFEILKKNVSDNNYGDRVQLFQLAASGITNMIYIEKQSSPYNKIKESNEEGLVSIKALNLEEIINNALGKQGKLSLLKIDCEGAEYDLLFKSPSNIFDRIDRIRMEHHDKKKKGKLIDFLELQGFKLIKEKYSILWFDKSVNL